MSELPEGWLEAESLDLFELVRGVSYDKSAITTVVANGFVPVLRANNISTGMLNRDELVFAPDRFVSDQQLLRPGDMVIASSSGSKAVVGKAAMVPDGFGRASFGAFCSVARPRHPDMRHWLRHYFATRAYRDFVERVALGININNLRGSDLGVMPIPVPPLAEQRRIVAKLDALTARTARARAGLDRIPALAARYKQAVLAKAFSGELTAEWRASNHQVAANVEEQDEARKLAWSKLPKRRGKYGIAELADWTPERLELPKTWRWASVDELVSMVQYGSSAKTSDDPAVPVLRMGNIVDGKLDLGKLKYLPEDHEEFPDLLLEDGDLLFNRTNSPELVGKTAVFRGVEGSTSFASYLIRLKSVNYHPELLSAYINSSFGRSWVATATSQQVGQANVNGSKLRRLGVPLPPFDEQLVIWKRIRSAFVEIDRLTAEAAAARRLLDKLDQATSAKAFRGELVPQDPADEPASVLLDRIRAERASAPKAARGRRKVVAT